jgi:hypothetical protein
MTAWLAGIGLGLFVGGITGLIVGMWLDAHGRDLEQAHQIEQIAALSTDLYIAQQEIRKLRGDIGVAWDGALDAAHQAAAVRPLAEVDPRVWAVLREVEENWMEN